MPKRLVLFLIWGKGDRWGNLGSKFWRLEQQAIDGTVLPLEHSTWKSVEARRRIFAKPPAQLGYISFVGNRPSWVGTGKVKLAKSVQVEPIGNHFVYSAVFHSTSARFLMPGMVFNEKLSYSDDSFDRMKIFDEKPSLWETSTAIWPSADRTTAPRYIIVKFLHMDCSTSLLALWVLEYERL